MAGGRDSFLTSFAPPLKLFRGIFEGGLSPWRGPLSELSSAPTQAGSGADRPEAGGAIRRKTEASPNRETPGEVRPDVWGGKEVFSRGVLFNEEFQPLCLRHENYRKVKCLYLYPGVSSLNSVP